VPSENGLRRDEGRDLRQRLASEPLADLGQSPALAVGEPQSPLQLAAQDPVLGREALVSEEDLLVDGAGDVGEEAIPGHGSDGNLPILGSN